MVPLEIFVVMPKAWKKEVFSGPRPVFWAGTVTSQGAIAPARAAAGTWKKGKREAEGMLTSQISWDGIKSLLKHSSRMDITQVHTSEAEVELEQFSLGCRGLVASP